MKKRLLLIGLILLNCQALLQAQDQVQKQSLTLQSLIQLCELADTLKVNQYDVNRHYIWLKDTIEVRNSTPKNVSKFKDRFPNN